MVDQLPQPLSKWLEVVRPEHRDLLARLHELLMSVEPQFTISLKWRNPAYSLDGQTFLYLADQAEYVHLGFYNGAQFDDPLGMVEGTGKRLRHFKVASLDAEIEPKLRQTVAASLAAGSEY